MNKKWKFFDPIKGKRGLEFYAKLIDGIFYICILETSGTNYDWMTNYSILLTRLFEDNKELKCHKGFLTLAYILINQLEKILKKEHMNIHHFNISGFSQGGAVALIAALLLHDKYPHCKFIVDSFGGPACVNRELKKRVENHINFCITNIYYKLDIVVNLIPYWLFGFFHAGDKVVLKQKWYNFFRSIKNHRKVVDLGYCEKNIKQ